MLFIINSVFPNCSQLFINLIIFKFFIEFEGKVFAIKKDPQHKQGIFMDSIVNLDLPFHIFSLTLSMEKFHKYFRSFIFLLIDKEKD